MNEDDWRITHRNNGIYWSGVSVPRAPLWIALPIFGVLFFGPLIGVALDLFR